jgi:hypothetical protein
VFKSIIYIFINSSPLPLMLKSSPIFTSYGAHLVEKNDVWKK